MRWLVNQSKSNLLSLPQQVYDDEYLFAILNETRLEKIGLFSFDC